MSHFLPPLNLPDGVTLLITDELASPADFILHRTIATYLKRPVQRREGFDHEQNNKTRVVILSISEDLARWKALASKFNLNLQKHLYSGSVIHMNLLAICQLSQEAHEHKGNSLRIAFDRVQQQIPSNPTNPDPIVVIFDDVSSLEWLGFPTAEVLQFVRALRALCLKTRTSFLIRHHLTATSDVNAEADDLFRQLLQICTYHLEVRPLLSGRSGTVTGEISLHRGFSSLSESDDVKLINRSSALQYRLTDSGPEFFAKGTSSGVL